MLSRVESVEVEQPDGSVLVYPVKAYFCVFTKTAERTQRFLRTTFLWSGFQLPVESNLHCFGFILYILFLSALSKKETFI